MKFLQFLDNKEKYKTRQEKNRNKAVFTHALELGFPPPLIRRAVLDLNMIRVKDLRNGHPLSLPLFYKTRDGERFNQTAMQLLADSVGLPVRVFFPESEA